MRCVLNKEQSMVQIRIKKDTDNELFIQITHKDSFIMAPYMSEKIFLYTLYNRRDGMPDDRCADIEKAYKKLLIYKSLDKDVS